MEEWKVILWNTRYEVSNKGRIRNAKTGRILSTNPTKSHKRPQVWLYDSYFGTSLQYTLARIVFFTFNTNVRFNMFNNNVHISHHDGNIMNCNLENLYIA